MWFLICLGIYQQRVRAESFTFVQYCQGIKRNSKPSHTSGGFGASCNASTYRILSRTSSVDFSDCSYYLNIIMLETLLFTLGLNESLFGDKGLTGDEKKAFSLRAWVS